MESIHTLQLCVCRTRYPLVQWIHSYFACVFTRLSYILHYCCYCLLIWFSVMIVCSLRRHIFLASFFLSHGSPLLVPSAFAMDSSYDYIGPSSSKTHRSVCLIDTLSLFEDPTILPGTVEGNLLIENVRHLYHNGSIIIRKYAERLGQVFPQSPESIPEEGIKLSEKFFKASLAYKNFLSAKGNKKKGEQIKILTQMVVDGNIHALYLFQKAYNSNLITLESVKQTKIIKNITNIETLYEKCKPDEKLPVKFLSYLYPENILKFRTLEQRKHQSMFLDRRSVQCEQKQKTLEDFQKALNAFHFNYKENPKNIGSIALELAHNHPQQVFWTHLAVENGMKEGCVILGRFYNSQLPVSLTQGLNGFQKSCLDFSRYYASKILENDLKPSKEIGEILYENGRRFYFGSYMEKKDFSKARTYWEEAAKQGNASAQYHFAFVLRNGEGGEIDLKNSRKYNKLAAKQGHKKAQYDYAYMCFNGEGGKVKHPKAREYNTLSAKQGDTDAQCFLAFMCEYGKGGDIDLPTAFNNYKLAAKQGHKGAEHQYARMLSDGIVVERNETKARKYYERSAKQGNTLALQILATMQYHGVGGEKNLSDALTSFKQLADQEHLKEAQYAYALMRIKGEGAERSLPDALKYSRLAAEQGEPDALFLFHYIEETVSDLSEKNRLVAEKNRQISENNRLMSDIDREINRLKKFQQVLKEELNHTTTPDSTNHEDEVRERNFEEKPLDSDVEIEFPRLESITPDLSDDEEKLDQYDQENAQRIFEFRVKKRTQKQAQKEAAAKTRHTLTVKEKEYRQTPEASGLKIDFLSEKVKSKVESKTLEFVKAIFGQGKINTFSNKAAKAAFKDLGCDIGKGNGENSTLVSFPLDLKKNREMKFQYEKLKERHLQEVNLNVLQKQEEKTKYHNPHGHGDNNLYNALKPHLKRFLLSINKTPETLQVR